MRGVMRHVEFIALFSLTTALAACSSVGPYAATATSLSETDYTWAPLDKEDFYVPSADEDVRSSSDFTACVDELSHDLARIHELNKEFGAPKWVPSPEARVLNLAGCMRRKGWHMVAVEPIVVTSAA